MTEDELRALDRRLAERLGYRTTEERYPRLVRVDGGRISGGFGREDAETCWRLDCPRFSSDGTAMLALMEWIRKQPVGNLFVEIGASNEWCVGVMLAGMDGRYASEEAQSLPLALALAADKALGASAVKGEDA